MRVTVLIVFVLVVSVLGKPTDDARKNGETKMTNCGGTLTASSGVIKTPNYPEAYPNSTECTWIIQTNGRIAFEFESPFDIEEGEYCQYDKLIIRDGASADSTLRFNLCGSTTPHNFVSTGSSMWISFVSDPTNAGQGFSLRYWQESCPQQDAREDDGKTFVIQCANTTKCSLVDYIVSQRGALDFGKEGEFSQILADGLRKQFNDEWLVLLNKLDTTNSVSEHIATSSAFKTQCDGSWSNGDNGFSIKALAMSSSRSASEEETAFQISSTMDEDPQPDVGEKRRKHKWIRRLLRVVRCILGGPKGCLKVVESVVEMFI